MWHVALEARKLAKLNGFAAVALRPADARLSVPSLAKDAHGPLFGVSDFDVFHQMVRGAGFHDSSVRELPIAWRTSSIEPFVASFRDWANLGELPKKVCDGIEAAVRERAKSYRSGHVFVIPNPAILISGVK